ncbi:unnamed protein product [Rhizophagus irregularis]|nr:unnamed protein product [Rhizophagus irregularis]
MDTSKQNSDTTKTDVKNLWKECDGEYQLHATIFSTDSTTESDETVSILKRVNIMDLEKRKEAYGVCGECNEPDGLSVQETISSSSANPISECLDCELNELDLKQDDDE